MASISYVIALIASALWFAAAFWYWSVHHHTSAKLFVPKTKRTSPLFPTIAALARFLGGMNGALAMLAMLLAFFYVSGSALFTAPGERGVLLLIFSAAHFSQFIYNVPILRNGGRRNESFWDVNRGPMLFIFVMDGGQALLNFAAACLQFL